MTPYAKWLSGRDPRDGYTPYIQWLRKRAPQLGYTPDTLPVWLLEPDMAFEQWLSQGTVYPATGQPVGIERWPSIQATRKLALAWQLIDARLAPNLHAAMSLL